MQIRDLVLVVEDEPLVREMAIAILTDGGFWAYGVADADEALQCVDGNPVRVVFADIALPGMSGIELANVIRERWPAIDIIVTSGQRSAMLAGLGADMLFIRKPYDAEALLRTVRAFVREDA